MYEYDETTGMYNFKGDLKLFLLNYGVDMRHIEKMQCKLLEEEKDAYYTIYDKEEKEKLVPLEKVIGVSRGTVGQSVYDNVRTMRGDQTRTITREPSRFNDCFTYFENYSLEQLKKSYENSPSFPVHMIHYVEDDEYYVSSNGNHRTLIAMLVGAKCIHAKVRNVHCDEEKKKKYLKYKSFLKTYNIEKITSIGPNKNIYM